ncbi:hypothetical protein [Gymnodinialimonas ulvae]|uniref:hypothetical protein n=1 Tax=Gymnodinialimonas ulvae TaxID=3126504 RepID=UPI0030AE7927
MKIRKKRAPTEQARVGDMIATQRADQVGLVAMLLRQPGTLNTLMSRRPREELGEALGRDNLLESGSFQLVFEGCAVEPVNEFYERKLFEFSIFDYSSKPQNRGSVVFRAFYKNTASRQQRTHRRIDRIIWDGEEVYVADGI